MRSGSDHRPIFFRGRFQMRPYYLAVLSTLFGLGLRFALDPWLKDQMPYVTFLVSVALAGLYAGVRPALLSTALGAAVAYFCFIPPRYHWGFADISDAVGFLAYLGAALAIVATGRTKRRTSLCKRESMRSGNLVMRTSSSRCLWITGPAAATFEIRLAGMSTLIMTQNGFSVLRLAKATKRRRSKHLNSKTSKSLSLAAHCSSYIKWGVVMMNAIC